MPTYSEEMLRSLRQDLEMTNGGLRDSEERAPASTQRSPWAVPKPQASPAVPPPKPKSSQADYPEVMKLNVGGRRFEVMRSTLMKSGALSAMISSTLAWPAEPDGSYFLDTDPDAFEHVLRFMRRPTIFPLFWSKSEGFDYALYHRVQTEANVFKVDALQDWIRDKKYLDAIHMHTLKAVKEDLDQMKEDTRLSNYSQDCYVVSQILCLSLSTQFTR
jgi:hypothetical protein